MSYRIVVLALVLAFAFAAPLEAGVKKKIKDMGNEPYETTLRHEERVVANSAVRFENLLGSITVRPVAKGRTMLVEARVVAEAADVQAARELAGTVRLVREEDKGTTVIHVAFPDERLLRLPRSEANGIFSKWVVPLVKRGTIAVHYDDHLVEVGAKKGATAIAVHLVVHLPLDVDPEVRQLVGSIHVAGLRGLLDLEILEGGVVAEQIYGTLQVRSAGGAIRVLKFHGEELNLETSSGEMELLEIDAKRAVVETSTGKIHGDRLTGGDLQCETGSGDVLLDRLDPSSLAIVTKSGHVELGTELRRTRKATIHSETGDVTLRIGRLAPFELLARTGKGRVKTKGLRFDSAEYDGTLASFKRGRGGAVLRVSTTKGSVTLRAL